RKTGAAVPLLWAHAEYVKLRRSAADGKSFDLIEPAYDRYVLGHRERSAIEVGKVNRQVPAVTVGTRLRIHAGSPVLLHWTSRDWRHSIDSLSTASSFDIQFFE